LHFVGVANVPRVRATPQADRLTQVRQKSQSI
jgi:hypothetical protein